MLKRAGFDGASMSYQTRTVEWHLPDAGYYFEAERNAGVRTAGILARNRQRNWKRFAPRLKMESNNTGEETISFYRWRRTWS